MCDRDGKYPLRIIFYFLFTTLLCNAQNNSFILSQQAHFGSIIAHHKDVEHIVKGHISGVELNFIANTNGEKRWQLVHKYPEIGFCALHMNLANSDQLGTIEAIYPFINLKLNKKENAKADFKLRLGTGLAYITKPFDKLSNHKNNVIGSHLNGFVNIRFLVLTKLSEHLNLRAGLGLSHASNGAYRIPNLGLNMATINLGLDYSFGQRCIYLKDSVPVCEREWLPSFIVTTGYRSIEPLGELYAAYGMQLNIYRQLNYKNSLGGGIETSYSNAVKANWQRDSVASPAFAQIFQTGAKLSYAYNIGNLSLPLDVGLYVYKKNSYYGEIFNRIGMRYLIKKHLIINVTLLAHLAQADYFEWGIGYQF